jgi:hypothetical protein
VRAIQPLFFSLTVTTVLLAMAGGVLAAPADHDHDAGPGNTSVYISILTGGQVLNVPPFLGPAAGHGVGFLTFDERSKVLCYSVSHTPIDNETTAHFHASAPPGQHSPSHAWPEEGDSLPIGSPKNGCTEPLGKPAEKALKDGLWFLAIHSSDYVLGELRGQVLPMHGVSYGKNVGPEILDHDDGHDH